MAFGYAISGAFNENQISNYQRYISNISSTLGEAGGWLSEQTNKIMGSFNTFLNSKAWEMSKRLLNKEEGEYVGRYDIGYLGTVSALQNADGLMRDYIMANPLTMQKYLDEEILGYEGGFSKLCTGIGEDNFFYRQAMSGLLNFTTEEDKTVLRHTSYSESLAPGLSFRDRESISRTWRALEHHLEKGLFDVTSNKVAEEEEITTLE